MPKTEQKQSIKSNVNRLLIMNIYYLLLFGFHLVIDFTIKYFVPCSNDCNITNF